MVVDVDEKVLQNLSTKFNIDFAEVLMQEEKSMRTEKIKKIHKYKIFHLGDGRLKTSVSIDGATKAITAKTEAELYEKLWDIYFGDTAISFEKCFQMMCDYRLEHNKVSKKTIVEYRNVFKRFFEGSKLIKKPINKITLKDMIKFLDACHDRHITKHNQVDIKTVISKTYTYANMYCDCNCNCPLNLIDFSDYPVTKEGSDDAYYTEENMIKLFQYMYNLPNKDSYDYAIELDLWLGLRIGELKALRLSDITNDGYIHIHAQVLKDPKEESRYVDYVKTKNEEGRRYLPLTKEALDIIEKAKIVSEDNDFLFTKDGKFLLTDTFNERLKKRCNEAKIPYYSSHKIRFGLAVRLANNPNCSLMDISKILGHTNTRTTSRYTRIANKRYDNAHMIDHLTLDVPICTDTERDKEKVLGMP